MNTVEIYTTPTCHFCHVAKDFFAQHNIAYTEYDVATDMEKRSQMVEMTGQMGVPVIIINGTDAFVGFQESAIAQLLGIEQAPIAA
jgi:glutaredoxin-like YruB-family protein